MHGWVSNINMYMCTYDSDVHYHFSLALRDFYQEYIMREEGVVLTSWNVM